MYAIVSIGDKQFTVREGDTLAVPHMEDAKEGKKLTISEVHFVGGDTPMVGQPFVKGAKVSAVVESHGKSERTVHTQFKRRKGIYKRRGARQPLTNIKVEKIALGGKTAEKAAPAAKAEEAPKAKAAAKPKAKATAKAVKEKK